MQGYRRGREDRRPWRKERRWWDGGEVKEKELKRNRRKSLPGFLLQGKVTGRNLLVCRQQTT